MISDMDKAIQQLTNSTDSKSHQKLYEGGSNNQEFF